MSKKLRVIRVVTGSENVPWHLGNSLKRMPADFEVCVVGQDVSSNDLAFPDVEWADIKIVRDISPVADLVALLRLCKLFWTSRPDIVHSIMPKAALLTALAGFICRVPVRIHTFTGQIWATKFGFRRKLFLMIDRAVIALNTMCLTDSPSQSRFLYDQGVGIDHEPLPVLGHGSLTGIDLEKFDIQKLAPDAKILRTQLGIKESDFVFAFIARKSFDKGSIDVLHAFDMVSKKNPKARLLFVGPDESRGQISQMRLKNPELFENVIEVGRVDNHEVYLAISNVLCLPSYREGFGTVVIDAAALRVPTIGSSIVGLIDSIEDGKTGILFPAGNIERLADLMLSFVKNEMGIECMGTKARERVEAYFTADQLYRELKSLYYREFKKHCRSFPSGTNR